MYEKVFDDNNDIRWGVLAEKPDWVFGAEMVACKGRSSKFSPKQRAGSVTNGKVWKLSANGGSGA